MKRITTLELRAYDAKHGTSEERELEMLGESLNLGGYHVQYWADVQLYGIKEANIYLENYVGHHVNASGDWPQDYAKFLAKSTEIVEKVTNWLTRK